MVELRQDGMQDAHTAVTRLDGKSTNGRLVACVKCGGTVAEVLARLGSTRCHDCRGGPRGTSALMGPAGPGSTAS